MNVGGISKVLSGSAARKLVRDADKACRVIAEEFPGVSSSRIQTFERVNTNQTFANYCKTKLLQNRAIRDDAWKLYNNDETLAFYRRFVENMKKYKNINCADYTKLTQLMLKANNIEAVNANILTQKLKGLDHAVLLVNIPKNGFGIYYKNSDLKNIIVIDPWLGFADFANNAVVRYNSEFSRFLGLENKYEKLFFDTNVNPEISEKTVEFMRKTFPNLIQKKGFMVNA